MSFRVSKQQYRQAEKVIAKFLVSAAGATLTKIAGNGNVGITGVSNQASSRDVQSPITVAAGVFTVVGPKCKLCTLVSALYYSGVVTNTLQIELFPVSDYNVSAGTQQFAALTNAGAAATMANGATLSFIWEIAK